jgi:hypothetical protein
MQHTLLPLPERKALRHEYRLRVAIVLCFMLSFAGLIGIGSLLPSFIAMSARERAELDSVVALKKQKDDSGAGDVEGSLKADAALLSAATPLAAGTLSSAVIESIVSARGPVDLTTLQVSHTDGSVFAIAIQGTAPDRSSLLAFQNRLEALAPGNKAVLPISELAKNSDIPFSIELTEKLP